MIKILVHKYSRHNEYYNISPQFDKIFKMSSKGYKFNKLYDLIFSFKNIRLAYRNIKNNKGSMTPGVDKVTIKNLQGKNTIRFLSHIRHMAMNFKPSKVRRVWIPKPNGKQRPIGIPTLKDRMFQQCVKQIIEPICEAKFHNHSYGFRPCRSTKHALARCLRLINLSHMHYSVDIDIKSFFDSIHHGKLLRQFWTLGIRDKRVLSIISKMLKAEVIGEGIPTKGTPQGGILSPLFSNICLNELDWWLSSQWETFPTKNKYTLTNNARRAVKKSRLKQFYFVRYADDFKIFCKDYSTATKIFSATSKFLKERLNLDVSSEKSTITNLRKKRSSFLGFVLKVRQIRNKDICFTRILPKALESMKIQLKDLIKKIQKKPSSETIKRYNISVLGFHNYYKCATHCTKDFAWLGYTLEKSIHNRLKRWISYIGQVPKSFKKNFSHKSPVRFIAKTPLFPIQDIRHEFPICFYQDLTPYTKEGRQKIHKELDSMLKPSLNIIAEDFEINQSIEFNDNRISKWVASKGKCFITGEYLGGSFECHHLTPRNKGGTDEYKNLIILSSDMHKLVHAVDSSLISNFLNIYELNYKQFKRLNYLRELVGNESLTTK